MTVFRMIATNLPPQPDYLRGRSTVRRKSERIIETLAPMAGVDVIVIAAGSRIQDMIYAADGGRWLQAIDMIDELAGMAAERNRTREGTVNRQSQQRWTLSTKFRFVFLPAD